jgi:predicted nucleotidyltransferase
MKNFNPEDYKIFECITGSNLYGTATPGSDIDYRGVCLPPLEILLDPFTGFEQKDSGFEEEDKSIYNLSKFMKLCADSNPNIIELLFIPQKNILFQNNIWEKIVENRQLFLSKKAKYTFSGYAMSQLQAIKTHRKWFIDPPKEKPSRKMFGLTDYPIISGENLQSLSNIPFTLFEPEVRDEIKRELEYRKEKQSWDNFISWNNNRNPERKRLEELYKYDVKHASHLVRLMTEGKELLLTGKITFPLPNADEVLSIKNGKYSYEEIVEMAENLDKEFEMWYIKSTLPHSADKKNLTELYLNIVLSK